MAKTKISEFSSTPGNNTDIDSINLAEGCAPSGINDAIRELMAQLKDFQTGAVGDSFNGPVGTTTAAAGAFTTLTASSTATLNTLASSGATLTGGTINGMAIGGTTAAAVSATTLTTSSTVTLNGGTANGVAYLNGSKVLTTGSALTFDGTDLATTGGVCLNNSQYYYGKNAAGSAVRLMGINSGNVNYIGAIDSGPTDAIYGAASTFTNQAWYVGGSEQMRLTSTGVGIGTSSPATKLQVYGGALTVGDEATYAVRFGNNSNKGVTIGYDTTNNVGHIGSINPAVAWTDLVINANGGNLGLGVTPSAWQTGANLKAFQVGVGAAFFSDTNSAYLGQNVYQNSVGTSLYINTNYASKYQQSSSVHSWHTAPSGTAGNAISFTQALSLTAAGNLLLGGTTDPGGTKVLYIGNGTTPGTPTSGGVLYVESGALKYKGSSGTVTTLGAA